MTDVVTKTSDPTAQRAEEMRDLKRQIDGLSAADDAEFIFRDTSPQRRKATVYSMQNGEPIQIPAYMLEHVLTKQLDDGRDAFTAFPEKAPAFKLGTVKCFLHRDSPDRLILEEIGLGGASCPAEHLASVYSKRIHGQHRHRQEWAAYQEHLSGQAEQENRDRQDAQLEATLAIARAAGGQAKAEMIACETCGKEVKGEFGLQAHVRAAHK